VALPWRDECLASQVEVVNTEPEGKATVESFTVHHNRENLPFRGVIVGRLENGAPPARKPHPNQSRSSGDETTESRSKGEQRVSDPWVV